MNCPLTIIYTVICSLRTNLVSKRYLATFLDDYTGLSAIKLLAHKSEIATVMKEIFRRAEFKAVIR